jgi:DNA-binding protein
MKGEIHVPTEKRKKQPKKKNVTKASQKEKAADVPAANVPAANVPAANVPAANVPAANVPAANVPAANVPAANSEVPTSVVLIGNKPVMNYVLACLTYFSSGSGKILLKARGRAIPRAVDTVELLKRSFSTGLQLKKITLSTEEVSREEGQTIRVSAIEIAVSKQ